MKIRGPITALLAAAGGFFVLALRTHLRRQARMDFQDKVVVITGGSRGLGLILARQWGSEGARLALLARDTGELARAEAELRERGVEVLALKCDVGNQAQVNAAIDQVLKRHGQVDVLVNNAGIIQVGPLENMQLADFRDAVDVHLWGPLYTMLAVIPGMRARKSGRIVNIASIGGKVAVPHLAPYSASKFGLVGLSNAFRAELSKDNILVTTVSPGLMRTGSHTNALFKGRQREEFAWFSIGNAFPLASVDAQGAARQIIEACRFGETSLIIGPQARALVVLAGLAPRVVAAGARLANWLLPRPETRWGDLPKSGWESQSRWSPSVLTLLADRAIAQNNEQAGRETTLQEKRG